MRTTVNVDDNVLAEVKRLALDTGRSVSAVLEAAARELLARQRTRRGPRPVALPTYPGWGLRPGLDLDDMASVLDVLDSDDDPA